MPIDSSNDPMDGGLGPDPASTKVEPGDVGVPSKADLDLDDAGTGAKSAPSIEVGNPKAGLDLSLDDAGRGAKVDPSLRDDDPTAPANKTGLGGALDHVDHVGHEKDLDLDGGKHLDIGAHDGHLHEDHIKGLTGVSHLHDDHDDPLGKGHDHDGHEHDHGHHDHGHDVHDH